LKGSEKKPGSYYDVRGEVMPLEIVVFHIHKVLHIYREQGEGKTLDHRVWTGGKTLLRGGGAPGGPKGGAACL
jgi:hypothetical protein